MTPSRVLAALDTLLAIRQPVFLWGPPGVGKSQLVAQAAERKGMALRDIRAVLLDPVDLRHQRTVDVVFAAYSENPSREKRGV